MSARQFCIVALSNGLPRAFGIWVALAGLLTIGRAVYGARWGAVSCGARSALAGVLLATDFVGAVYFVIAVLWYLWAQPDVQAPGPRERTNNCPT